MSEQRKAVISLSAIIGNGLGLTSFKGNFAQLGYEASTIILQDYPLGTTDLCAIQFLLALFHSSPILRLSPKMNLRVLKQN